MRGGESSWKKVRGHSVASYVQKDTPANSFLPDDVTYAAFVR